jgi:hypothetical protein
VVMWLGVILELRSWTLAWASGLLGVWSGVEDLAAGWLCYQQFSSE